MIYIGCVVVKSGVVFSVREETAYDMLISDWSSDVCSSYLNKAELPRRIRVGISRRFTAALDRHTVSFYQWMNNDKVVSQTMALLLAKLLESDRDQAYTRATEPDFKTIRSDFYALANFIKDARGDHTFDEKYPPPESPEFLSLPMRVHAPKNPSEGKLATTKAKSKAKTKT